MRFPAEVYGVGDEPDPRFSLANERTFLAWLRTAMGLVAVAAALLAFDLPVGRVWTASAAGLLAVDAVVAGGWAWWSWAGTERMLRRRQPLPGSGGPTLAILVLFLAGAVTLLTGLVVAHA